jgi:phage shock protein E
MGYSTRRFAATVVLIAGLSAGAVTGLAGCSGSGGNGAHLSVSAFATETGKTGVVVLDVRTPSEFASGHLANAKNLDIDGGDFAQQIAGLDKNASYAVYCRTGHRSGLALDQMKSAGFTHVVDLSGGITAWTADGHQVVTGS